MEEETEGEASLPRTSGNGSVAVTVKEDETGGGAEDEMEEEDEAKGESEDEMEEEREGKNGNSGNSGNSPLPMGTGGGSEFCTVSDGGPSLGRTFGEAGTEDEADDEEEGEDEAEDEEESEWENESSNSSLPKMVAGVCNNSDGGPSLPRSSGEAGTEAEAESKGREDGSRSSRNSIP